MTSKKRLLILNGSHSDIPLINAAKKLGYYVITTGNLPNLIGHAYADEYHSCDFSDVKAVLKLAEKLKIDGVVSCTNDFGLIAASYVGEKLGLPGHDTYENSLTLHHKNRFKKVAQANEIPVARTQFFNSKHDALEWFEPGLLPLIVKPVDLTGGKGVSKAESHEDYVKAVHIAFDQSRVGHIVVEEFIVGTQHSFSTFIVDHKVVFSFSDNEFSYLNPFLVSTSSSPALFIDEVRDQLIASIEKMAELLHLRDGLFHLQYILDAQHKLYIIEPTRRCSGDLYPYPVNYALKIDWPHWIVKAESGIDCKDFPRTQQQGFCGRHCIMSPRNGIMKNVIVDPSLKENIYDELLWWKPGDVVDNYLVQKMGIYCLRYDSMEEMISKTNNITNLVRVELQ